ncbi:hypothetical protein TNCV_5051161 [Trichonephila clavipes]|nr:hypothetical protein TNCV_5051161 [Trichonephila clavipes]
MRLFISSGGRGSLVVKVSDRGWRVVSSSPVPLKTRHFTYGVQRTKMHSTEDSSARHSNYNVAMLSKRGQLRKFSRAPIYRTPIKRGFFSCTSESKVTYTGLSTVGLGRHGLSRN